MDYLLWAGGGFVLGMLVMSIFLLARRRRKKDQKDQRE